MQSIKTISHTLMLNKSVIFVNGKIIHKIQKTEDGEFEFDIYKNLGVDKNEIEILIDKNEIEPFQKGVFTLLDGTANEIISEVIALGRAC